MRLNELKSPKNSRRKKKRLGRGNASGHGRTCGKGQDGQMSRSGAKRKKGYEGGQMPLQRRVPKFGFTNIFKKKFQIVNLDRLDKFVEGETVNKGSMLKSGLIKKKNVDVKILGKGKITKSLTIEANAFSKSAVDKISEVGGKAVKV